MRQIFFYQIKKSDNNMKPQRVLAGEVRGALKRHKERYRLISSGRGVVDLHRLKVERAKVLGGDVGGVVCIPLRAERD